MVDFLRNPPDLASGFKYVYYSELFPDLDNQDDVVGFPPNQYLGIATEELGTITPTQEDKSKFSLTFVNGTEPLVVIKNVFVTISGNGIASQTYDMFNDPDTVRLSTEPSLALGFDYPKLPDGLPDTENMTFRNVVKIMFNSLPLDEVDYLIEVVDENESVWLSDSGKFRIIDELPVNQL